MKKIISSLGLLFTATCLLADGFQPLPSDMINNPSLLCDAKTLQNYQAIINASPSMYAFSYGVFFNADDNYLFNVVDAAQSDCSGGVCTYIYGYTNGAGVKEASGICAFKGTTLWSQVQSNVQSLLTKVISAYNAQQNFPLPDYRFGYEVVCKNQLPSWGANQMPTDADYQKDECRLQQVY